MAPTTIQQLLKAMNYEQLKILAENIMRLYPKDCQFDVTTTVDVLRNNLMLTLRSHPEFMVGVPGLETMRELIAYREATEAETPEPEYVADMFQGLQPFPKASHSTHPVPSAAQIMDQSPPAGASEKQKPLPRNMTEEPDRGKSPEADHPPTVAYPRRSSLPRSPPSAVPMAYYYQPPPAQAQASGTSSRSQKSEFSKEATRKNLSFDGRSSENLGMFLVKVERLLDDYELSERDKISVVCDLLRGDAELFAESIRDTLRTYRELRTSLEQTYCTRLFLPRVQERTRLRKEFFKMVDEQI